MSIVDYNHLEMLQKSSAKFIDLFCEKLTKLVQPDFIEKQQSSFLYKVKDNFKDGTILIFCNFYTIYTFVIQDGAQSA